MLISRSGGDFLVVADAFLHRAGIEALGAGVTIDELDHSHGRVVAIAEAGLEVRV